MQERKKQIRSRMPRVFGPRRQVGNVMTQAGSSDLGFYRILSRKIFPWETPMRYLRDSANLYAHQISVRRIAGSVCAASPIGSQAISSPEGSPGKRPGDDPRTRPGKPTVVH